MMPSLQGNNASKVSALHNFFPVTLKCLQMFGNRIVFWYSISNLILFTSLFLVILIYGLIHPTMKFWLTYGQIPLLCTILNIQLIVSFISFNEWEQAKVVYATEFSWDLNILPLDTKNKVLYTCKQTDISFVVSCSLTICSGIAVLEEVNPMLWEIVSALDFMENYVPHCKWIFVVVLWINSNFMAFTLMMGLYYWFVPLTLTRIQLIMLYSVTKKFKKSTAKQRSDKYVEENLKNIINKHQNILRIYGETKRDAFFPLFLITISLLFTFLYNTIIFHSPYCGIVSPLVTYFATLIVAAYFCRQGQNLEDQYNDFFTLLYDLNWYEWSINNMKTFKTLFLNSSGTISESDTALFQINHSYFKKSIKVMYALINLARTFSHQ